MATCAPCPVLAVAVAGGIAFGWISFASRELAAAPHGTRHGPLASQALAAARGERIGFSVSAADAEGGLSGIEWYLDGSFLGAQYVADVAGAGAAALFWRGVNFPELGAHVVEGVPFDRAGHYGAAVRWDVSVRERRRLLYVDHTETRLDEPAGIAALRAQVAMHRASQVAIYGLHLILPDTQRTARLRELVRLLHHDGVERVFAVVASPAGVRGVGDYLAAPRPDPAPERFDGLVTESEFWNGTPFADYLALLAAMRELADAQGMVVATYLGWPDPAQAAAITARVDLVLLHAYRSVPDTAYGYIYDRLALLAGPWDHPVEIWPIFSAECDFMGGWLGDHATGGGDPLEIAEATLLDGFRGDPRTLRNGVRLDGFAWFAASRLETALAGGCR